MLDGALRTLLPLMIALTPVAIALMLWNLLR
jgi:hypothetical protein